MTNSTQHFTIGQLFTEEQLRLAAKIISETPDGTQRTVRLVKEVVEPALPRINEVTKQENDASYMAYALQWAFTRSGPGR